MSQIKAYIKQKPLVIAAILITASLLLTLCFSMLAESEGLKDHFTVWCDDPSIMSPIPVALIYERENSVTADGILCFTPLKEFLEFAYDVPTIVMKNSQLFHVEYDAWFYDQFDMDVIYYEATDDSFINMEKEYGNPVDSKELKPGDYLMAINIHAEKGKEYYVGAAFLHIIVPGKDKTVWPVKVERLTLTVVPTLSPTPTQTVYINEDDYIEAQKRWHATQYELEQKIANLSPDLYDKAYNDYCNEGTICVNDIEYRISNLHIEYGVLNNRKTVYVTDYHDSEHKDIFTGKPRDANYERRKIMDLKYSDVFYDYYCNHDEPLLAYISRFEGSINCSVPETYFYQTPAPIYIPAFTPMPMSTPTPFRNRD